MPRILPQDVTNIKANSESKPNRPGVCPNCGAIGPRRESQDKALRAWNGKAEILRKCFAQSARNLWNFVQNRKLNAKFSENHKRLCVTLGKGFKINIRAASS
jgi:hypothetical protein